MLPELILLSSIYYELGQFIVGDYERISDIKIQNERYQFESYDIKYQHSLWRINYSTVCADYNSRLTEFSKCGKAAKNLFIKACKDFSAVQAPNAIQTQHLNMYCQAAKQYQPVVAQITFSKESMNEKQLVKQRCSNLTLKLQTDNSPVVLNERERVCNLYKRLQE